MNSNKAAHQLALACSEIRAISKTKTNTQGQGYKYRGVDDFMNHLGPIFRKYGLTLVVDQFLCDLSYSTKANQYGKEVEWTRAKLGTNYSVICEDGSSVKISTVYSEGLDNSDKAIPKAMSMALKTMLSQVFLVPTEDIQDPDSDTPEIEKEASNNHKKHEIITPQKAEWNKEAELKRFFALAKQKLISIDEIKEFMKLEFGIESTNDIKKTQLDMLGILIENNQFKQSLQTSRDRKIVK